MGTRLSFASSSLIDLAPPLDSGRSTWSSLLRLHDLDEVPIHSDQRRRSHEAIVRD
jgi:hypothetical protein